MHPNVVTIHAVDEHRGVPYLVMQFVAGMSLQTRLDQEGALPLPEALRIGVQAAAGLAAAHKEGLIHRDVKPGNILLENGIPHVKLTDFGLARAADDASLTQSGVVAGTPQYMSPEQARGDGRIDHRADLFSLGSVLYKMVTGREPFRAGNVHAVLYRVISDAPPSIRTIDDELPPWLDDLIARLHAKEPDDRPQSAEEVAELLRQHLAHLEEPDRHPRPARLLRNRQSWRGLGVVGMAAGLLVALATAVLGVGLCAIVMGWMMLPPWLLGPGPPPPPPEFDGKGRPPVFDPHKPPPPHPFPGKKPPPPPPRKDQ
jgi:serine/threonine protein kinase